MCITETTYVDSRWEKHDEDADGDEEADDGDCQENGCPGRLAVSRMHCSCITLSMLAKYCYSLISIVIVNSFERVHVHIHVVIRLHEGALSVFLPVLGS